MVRRAMGDSADIAVPSAVIAWLCRGAVTGLVAALAWWPPATAAALAHLAVEGEATLSDARVEVVCEDRDAAWVRCTVELRGTLTAGEGGARLRAAAQEPMEGVSLEDVTWSTDAGALRRERALNGSERVALRGGLTLDLDTRRGWDGLLVHPGLGVRHPLLGESWLQHHQTLEVELTLVRGATLASPPEVEVRNPSRAAVAARPDGAVSFTLCPPHGGPPQGALAHGGPVVTVGGELTTGRAVASVGYEVGLFDLLILSAWFESDFRSISQAVIAELVAPGAALFTVPSLSAGLGFVARELGADDPRFGLRVRLSASSYALGFVVDFDYLPSAGEWRVSLAARLGL